MNIETDKEEKSTWEAQNREETPACGEYPDQKERLLELIGSSTYTPLSDEEMAAAFGVSGREAAALINQLDELVREGKVLRTKKEKYMSPRAMGIIIGTVAVKKQGYAFLIPEDRSQEDVFLPPRNLNSAMNGDLVAVRLLSPAGQNRRTGRHTAARGGVRSETVQRHRRTGTVERILRRAKRELVGTFYAEKNFGFVVADDPREREELYVAAADFGGAEHGDKVAAQITVWPDAAHSAEGVITEIISRRGEQGGDVRALIRSHGIREPFPDAALAEAAAMPQTVTFAYKSRRDLRDKTIITIDGADSKDFDDAVSVERLENGNYLLGVHIADVSHYVCEGSALDREAARRGNSVYLIDKVIPMLPVELSNGLCSLNPGVDRLTLTCDMEVDGQGHVVRHEIYESVIRSARRMIYSDVSDMLEAAHEEKDERAAKRERAAELRERYASVYPDLLLMDELAAVLREARERRGSLDFDFDEAYITLNDEGIPVSVETAERRVANQIIEEFMLLANETVAEDFYWREAPFIYRIHEKPAAEKVEELQRFLRSFGIVLMGNADHVHPRALNAVLTEVRGRPEEHVVNTVTLRSMKKAFYGTQCLGHFGLGVRFYCHFTSPIRRYPDLMIHRIIKEYMREERAGRVLSPERFKALQSLTADAAERSSETEREAQELERDVEKLKTAEYMSYHIGEEYEGIISGVAAFGFFVELENTVEGMVRAADLADDYYDYEQEKYRLIGRRRHKVYALGQAVSVRVDSVDVRNREINFTVIKRHRENGIKAKTE